MRTITLVVLLLVCSSNFAGAWQEKGKVVLSGGWAEGCGSIGEGEERTDGSSYFPENTKKLWFFCSIRSVTAGDFDIIIGGKKVGTLNVPKSDQWYDVCYDIPTEKEFLHKYKIEIIRVSGRNTENDVFRVANMGFAYSSPEAETKPYKMLIHLHTKYSDGKLTLHQSVEMAKSYGYQIVVFTDHYEKINPSAVEEVGGNKVLVGLRNYLAECAKETNSSFVAVPGTELCSRWKKGLVSMDGHMVAFPLTDEKVDQQLLNSTNTNNSALSLARTCLCKGMVVGIAHPFLSDFRGPLHGFAFDFPEIEEEHTVFPRGIECRNNNNEEEEELTLDKLVEYSKNPAIVLSAYVGNDSHSPEYPGDNERWLRANYIYLTALTQDEVVKAFSEGRTIATDLGVENIAMSIRPDGFARITDEPHFNCLFSFVDPKTKEEIGCVLGFEVRLYRDGELVPGSKKEVPAHSRRVDYSFIDKEARAGYHRYILVIGKYLTTSPMEVVVVK